MQKNLVVLDCEVYPNYFLIAFKNIKNGKCVLVDIYGENAYLSDEQKHQIGKIMSSRTTFGFNSRNYDIPILMYALNGKTCNQIYHLSKTIIESDQPSWLIMRSLNLYQPREYSHFDVQEPAQGVGVSLKLYGGRLNSKTLQDLPIDPHTHLSDEDVKNIRLYCVNDLDTTIDLYNHISDRIALREKMSLEYGQDLLSKSDAQIAEAVIRSKLSEKNRGRKIKPPILPDDTIIRYSAPSFIKFKTKQLNEILKLIESTEFTLNKNKSVQIPKDLEKLKIVIGNMTYKIGIGGLHSQEKSQIVKPNSRQYLIDKDVTSYYPSIILNQKFYPKHLGENFLEVYRNIVEERIAAKKSGDTVVNESLKIVINGGFGKFGSKWSVLYSPDLLLNVTLTGQLSLLMLIESIEAAGNTVVSANTDGFVTLLDHTDKSNYEKICNDWETSTGFLLEDKYYNALYSRDVNNYLAVHDGGHKSKGAFALGSISKNPQTPICYEAVINYLINGDNLKTTIENCTDLTKFITVRTVKGGAVWKNDYLGKVVRWIYSRNGDTIFYKSNGNKVAKSDGSRPVMTLGDFPEDLDYDRYLNEALKILETLGVNCE